MTDFNKSNLTLRREDWKHTVNAAGQPREAKRVPLSMIREKPATFEFTPAPGRETHPLRLPPTLAAASQVDWMAGREYHDRKAGNVRSVSPAEIDELLSWGMDKVLMRYPRAQPGPIASFLRAACHDPQRRLLRTNNACGLFQYAQTAWEPLPVVSEVFVAVREPQTMALDIRRIYSAAMAWAHEVGAAEFCYGGSTGVDIGPVAKKIGYEHRRYEFSKRLDHVHGARG